jgi:hypothetical protein
MDKLPEGETPEGEKTNAEVKSCCYVRLSFLFELCKVKVNWQNPYSN